MNKFLIMIRFVCVSSEIWTRFGLVGTRLPVRARAHDAYEHAGWERSVTANRDAHRDADASEDADGCRLPSDDHVDDIDEDFRSKRRLRPPPSGNPPYSGSPRCEKPIHPPPRRCYHAPLSRDFLRSGLSATSCSLVDEQRRSRIMAASRSLPLVLAWILPTVHCRNDTLPWPVKESEFNKISRDYRFRNSNFIIVLRKW